MNVICSVVISPNGYIARLDGTEDYITLANWSEFIALAKKYNNFVTGRKTLDIVTNNYDGFGFEDIKCQHKIIVSGQKNLKLDPLYTRADSPQDVIAKLTGKVDNILLVGGGELNSAFAAQNLINEVTITIEPHIIGQGINLFAPANFDLDLSFKSIEKLTGGRVRISYSVNK